jgi:type IV pilus assembly protein PilE
MAFKTKVSRRTSGFTLLELMITVLVVAILGVIVYPTFMQSIYKGRRTDAKASLTEIQQAAERWRSNNTSYPPSLAAIYPTTTSKSGHYNLAFTPLGNATTYEVTATARGIQANDTQCYAMQISMGPSGITYKSSSDGSTFTESANDPCWPR